MNLSVKLSLLVKKLIQRGEMTLAIF